MTRIRIIATETTTYARSYELEELEEQAGVALSDCHSLESFIEKVHENASDSFIADLERHGEVQGQTWEAAEGESAFADFDRYCEEHNITPEEAPAAFGAWLNESFGWDGQIKKSTEKEN